MAYETVLISEKPYCLIVTIHRPQARNSINSTLLQEINEVLDRAEHDTQCRLVIFQGSNGIFCTGMDFFEAVAGKPMDNSVYMSTLKRFTLTSKVIISKLDGQVLAGGLGLAAASDLVIATKHTQFNLPEAMWGLLPANVLPYLIRRVGFQKAYEMVLTMQTVSAEEAHRIHLVDTIAEDLDETIRRLMLRLIRVDVETIIEMKNYFRKMWIISAEMEHLAIEQFARLLEKDRVQKNIRNFVEKQIFPWEDEQKNK
ncbi:MAG: enoyl-CoA hydratase-related protein [Acidobacteriota bacterium]